MKMTKIAFWRKVKENCEKNKIVPCTGIYDSDCPYGTGSKECKMCEGGNGKEALAYAEAYIKRHEQKSKKRIIPKYTADVQPDTTGSELKKIVMKPANTDPTPLEIAKMIRDNGYVINCKDFSPNLACGSCTTDFCDHILSREKARASIKKIDDYISSHEKIEPVCEHLVGDLCGNAFEDCNKECPANSELKKPEPVTVKAFEGCHALIGNECMNYMKCGLESCPAYNSEPVIEPIKFDDPVPEYVYWTEDSRIERVASASFFATKERDNINAFVKDVIGRTYNLENCYKTLDDAVAVAKKTWGLK